MIGEGYCSALEHVPCRSEQDTLQHTCRFLCGSPQRPISGRIRDNTIPAAAWRGHPPPGFLGSHGVSVEIAVRRVAPLEHIPQKTSENPAIVPLRPSRDSLGSVEKHNVLVIAANRLLRDLLCDRVTVTPEFNLVGSDCGASIAALELINTAEDVVVLLWIPDRSGPKQVLGQIDTLRSASPCLRLVLIGMPAIEDVFLTTVRAGVAGYVLDDAPIEEVIAAVRLVARGEAACPSQLLPALFRCVAAQPESALMSMAPNRFGLSRRERQLVPMIAQGKTNKEIASELCLSEQTVKNHLRRMMRKAGAPNRFAVVERCQFASAADA